MLYRLPDGTIENATPTKEFNNQAYDQVTGHWHGPAIKNYGVPCIDQVVKAPGRSDRYGFVSTAQVLTSLELKGWTVKKISYPKKSTRGEHSKHMVELENERLNESFGDATLLPRMFLVNSHDGSSSLQLRAGIYRLVCSNGLMVGEDWAALRVLHRDSLIKDVGNGIDTLVARIPHLVAFANKLKSVTLSPEDAQAAIRAAVMYRLPQHDSVLSITKTGPRRTADLGMDAFTVFNRVQELIIKGRFQYMVRRINAQHNPEIVSGTAKELKAVSAIVNGNLKAYEIAKGWAS